MGSSPIRVAIFGSVAQLVEQRTENPRVTGSIPVGATISAGLAHLVERMPYKHDVTGSSPVVPTKLHILNQSGAVVQLVRTPACHAGGRGFKSLPSRHLNFPAIWLFE